MHHHIHGFHPVIEDRDVSRAASERYLMLQALSEHHARTGKTGRARSRRNWLHRLLNAAAPTA